MENTDDKTAFVLCFFFLVVRREEVSVCKQIIKGAIYQLGKGTFCRCVNMMKGMPMHLSVSSSAMLCLENLYVTRWSVPCHLHYSMDNMATASGVKYLVVLIDRQLLLLADLAENMPWWSGEQTLTQHQQSPSSGRLSVPSQSFHCYLEISSW